MSAPFGALRCSDLKVLRCSRTTDNINSLRPTN
jgi:hypothetical protein